MINDYFNENIIQIQIHIFIYSSFIIFHLITFHLISLDNNKWFSTFCVAWI